MFLLTLQNNPSSLEYRLWKMEDIGSALLVWGKITGIGMEVGGHTYSYGFGSGKGKCRTAGYDEAVNKIDDIIKIAARGFKRLEGIEIGVEGVGYLMRKRPSGVTTNRMVDKPFIENLEEIFLDEQGDADLASDIELIKSSSAYFSSARHVAVFDEIMFRSVSPEIKLYPIPPSLSLQGRINKFTHGALRLSSIIENARGVLRSLPRRIVVCDIDETTHVTAIKGGGIVASTHEYGGTSTIFSAGNCGAINPAVLKAMSEKGGLPFDEVIDSLVTRSGVRNFDGGFASMRDVAASIRGENINTIAQMLLSSVVYSIAGMVALLGGIELLIISGDIGADFPALRSLIVKKLHILRLSVDENQNESEIKDAAEITGKDCKVKIVVARPATERQIAVETMNIIQQETAR